MPFSKTWDKKVKIAVFPFRRNDSVVCHNCWKASPKEDINCCTGLCSECVKLNPINFQMPKKQVCIPEGEFSKCVNCNELLNCTNFGIYRQDCKKCLSKNISMQQRCIVCERTGNNYWNNICHICMGEVNYLCENNGYTFLNQNHHYRLCWCLNHEQQALRGRLIRDPSLNSVMNTE